MCCTFRPAKLSKTIIYSGESTHPDDGRYIHVMGYQNRAASAKPGPNAMILPIPSVKPLGPENIIDMRSHPDVLKEMAVRFERPAPLTKSIRRSRSTTVQVFKSGSYTILLATDARDILQAVGQLPEDLRPEVNEEILDAYAAWYPGWPIALCVWDGQLEAEPLLWWYEPLSPNTLFYPGLDAHDGKAPDTDADIRRDHTLLTGSTINPFGARFKLVDLGPATGYIATHGWGIGIDSSDFNRDYRVDVKYLRTLSIAEGTSRSTTDLRIMDIQFDYYLPPAPLEKSEQL